MRTKFADKPRTETGGLIRMLARLLEATSPLVHKPNVRDLTTVLGRCYALRDDYKNISSTEVSEPLPVPKHQFELVRNRCPL